MKFLKLYENFDFDEDDFDEEEFFEIDYKYDNLPKFPTYENREDYYFIYDLNKNELGKYLNRWFSGVSIEHKGEIISDNVITIKIVDGETRRHLYYKKYNPISLSIMKLGGNKKHDMKCSIRSIDNSSYSIWFHNRDYDELKQIREKLMNWIDTTGIGKWSDGINGENFLKICISNGAYEHTIDYD